MTRVKALKLVVLEGREFEADSVLNIDDDLAQRWIKGGWAKAVKADPKQNPKPEAAAVSPKAERAVQKPAKPRRI